MSAVQKLDDRLKTRDCRIPGCILESEFDGGPCDGLCRAHAERVVKAHLEPITDDLAERRAATKQRQKIGHRSVWTRDEIISALRSWAEEHGELPYAAQWKVADEGRPTDQTVRNVFGSWDTAIEAAGLTEVAVTRDASDVLELEGEEVEEQEAPIEPEAVEDPAEQAAIEEEPVAPPRADPTFDHADEITPEDPSWWLSDDDIDRLRVHYITVLIKHLDLSYSPGTADRIERLLWAQ